MLLLKCLLDFAAVLIGCDYYEMQTSPVVYLFCQPYFSLANYKQ